MPITTPKYYRLVKYDSFGNTPTVLPKKYNAVSAEVNGVGKSLTASIVGNAKQLGVNPFDILEVQVSNDPTFASKTNLYRGQHLTIGNKKKTNLSAFQLTGLEDSLRYIKPTQRVYGTVGVFKDVSDIFFEIASSLINILKTNNTLLYANLYKVNGNNFVNSGVEIETITLIAESYFDLFEYCVKLCGNLNYSWGLDTEGILFFKPINGLDTITINDEVTVEWKDVNCAAYVNTVDFYIPTNNDTDALERRVVNPTALDNNGDLKYPERRKTYLLSADLLDKITFTNQYYANTNNNVPFNPTIPNIDVINPNPSYTHNQFQMYSPYLVSPSFLLDPELAFTLTDNKSSSYFTYPVVNLTGPFTTLNPFNNSGQWRWTLGSLAADKVIAYNAHIEFDTDCNNLNPNAFNKPDGTYTEPYFEVIFARKGLFETKKAFITFTISNSGSTIKILKKDPIPKFDNAIYSVGKHTNNSTYEGLLVTNWGNATFVKIKVFEFALYSIDENLLFKIANALFKDIPEDPGTLFINGVFTFPTTNLSFQYRDEMFVVQGITRKALLYRYLIQGEDYLTTEIELEQAYSANNEQTAQIVIDRDTDVKNYTLNQKRAVA